MMLKDAIEKDGTTNADKIVPHIEKGELVGTGALATFDKRHDLVWAVGKTSGIAVQWQDGKKVPFWPPTGERHAAFQDAGALSRKRRLLQDILVTGLVNGGVYALLAIGFSLIFGVARIVNIAHTAFYMLAAYCSTRCW